ncbi:MAG: signal peptidase I [Candidatus Kariarchaeaceae archaeon]|jgi:signal peptidase I
MEVNVSKTVRYAVAILVIFSILLIFAAGYIFDYDTVVIGNDDTNSMYPTYRNGDLLIVKPPSSISIGDVIVYEKIDGFQVIHRVQDVRVIEGTTYYRCKGDNFATNPTLDRPGFGGTLIPSDQVKGVVVGHIPVIGNIYSATTESDETRNFVIFILVMFIIFISLAPLQKIFYFSRSSREDVFYSFDTNKKMDEIRKLVCVFWKKATTRRSLLHLLSS